MKVMGKINISRSLCFSGNELNYIDTTSRSNNLLPFLFRLVVLGKQSSAGKVMLHGESAFLEQLTLSLIFIKR